MKDISRYRTILMGFAALWIYCFHIVPAVPLGHPVLNQISCYLKDHGSCGVDIFLLLSGFGLVHVFQKTPINSWAAYLRYACRRVQRIWLVLVPAAAVFALVDGWSLLQYLGRCTGILQLTTYVYDFLWFVPCILIFYLLAPLYARLLSRMRYRFLTTCIVIAVWIVLLFLLRGTVRSDLYAILNRVPVFLLGFYFGDFQCRKKTLQPGHYAAAGLTLITGIAISVYLGTLDTWPIPACNALANLPIAAGVVLLGSTLCRLLEQLQIPVLRQLIRAGMAVLTLFGTISLEFYVLQEWLWGKLCSVPLLLQLLGSNMWLQQLAAFVLITAAALLLHQLTRLPAALWRLRSAKAQQPAG